MKVLQSSFSTIDPDKWDQRFFELCSTIAQWSEDNSRKIGAVIVGNANEIRTTGYNGLPRGVNGQVSLRHTKEFGEKYHWYEHAERNAIFNAARTGIALEGCTIYSSLFPCAECSRAIIQSGISTLKSFEPPFGDKNYERSFEVSMEMLSEAGVNVKLFAQ
ncbi:MAG: dCMP deaminase family protein [Rhodobacter sp.]|jgi:dCMP deaminase|nr:dCMP deaminase family protein [Rhodobacter sp.]